MCKWRDTKQWETCNHKYREDKIIQQTNAEASVYTTLDSML